MKKAIVITIMMVLALGLTAFAFQGSCWNSTLSVPAFEAFEARAGPRSTQAFDLLELKTDAFSVAPDSDRFTIEFGFNDSANSIDSTAISPINFYGMGLSHARESVTFTSYTELVAKTAPFSTAGAWSYIYNYNCNSTTDSYLIPYTSSTMTFDQMTATLVAYVESTDYAYNALANAFSRYYGFNQSAVIYEEMKYSAELEAFLDGQSEIRTYNNEVRLIFFN